MQSQTVINYPNWMSYAPIQNKKVSSLYLPGTHDSGSFWLSEHLSDIKYPGISFLWNLSPYLAPVNGQFPWNGGTYYLGGNGYVATTEIISGCALSGDQSISQQLNAGIRYFDFRIYYDCGSGNFYIQHALQGKDFFNDIVPDMVNNYFQKYDGKPGFSELIFFDISHTNFNQTVGSKAVTDIFISMLQSSGLSKYIYTDAFKTGSDFSNSSFSYDEFTKTLGSLEVKDICNNQTKIIFLNTDVNSNNIPSYTYSDCVVTTQGFTDSGRFQQNSNGTNVFWDMQSDEQSGLNNNQINQLLYRVQWTLTAQTSDVVSQVANYLSANNQLALQNLASIANNGLETFLITNKYKNFNVVTVDWFEYGYQSAAYNIVKMLIDMNNGVFPQPS